MKRTEFLSSACACTLGLCSCAGFSMVTSNSLIAGSEDPKKEESDWRLGFMQKRFAGFIRELESTVDAPTQIKIIENLGRTCAKESTDTFKKYKEQPEGFLSDIASQWAEKTEFDPKEKKIRIVGKKALKCFCPFVDKSMMPKNFCQCSVGNMKETWGAILGKPVDVKIEESILYGEERCTFVIRYT